LIVNCAVGGAVSRVSSSVETRDIPPGTGHAIRVNEDGGIELLPPRSKPDPNELVEVYVTEKEHEALLSIQMLFDWHLEVIKAVELTEDGMMFRGKVSLIEDLAGLVASEVMHLHKTGKRGRRMEVLNEASDAIEDALR
jgi:hypothetical protein